MPNGLVSEPKGGLFGRENFYVHGDLTHEAERFQNWEKLFHSEEGT